MKHMSKEQYRKALPYSGKVRNAAEDIKPASREAALVTINNWRAVSERPSYRDRQAWSSYENTTGKTRESITEARRYRRYRDFLRRIGRDAAISAGFDLDEKVSYSSGDYLTADGLDAVYEGGKWHVLVDVQRTRVYSASSKWRNSTNHALYLIVDTNEQKVHKSIRTVAQARAYLADGAKAARELGAAIPKGSQTPEFDAWKLVANIDGRYLSIFDGETEYRVGEATTDTAKRDHEGGIYVYPTREQAERAVFPNGSQLLDAPRIVLHGTASGRRFRYDSGKIACTTFTVTEAVEVKNWSDMDYDY